MQRNRIVSLFWVLLGVGVLVVSVSGTRWMISPQPGGTNPSAGSDVAETDVVSIGHVDVESGVSGLLAAQPNRVVAVEVREGDTVRPGQVLLKLDDRLAKRQVEDAETAVDAAKLLVEQAQRAPAQHEAQLRQANEAVAMAKAEAAAARKKADYYRKLNAADGNNLGSQAEQDAAEELTKKAEAAERLAQARLDELKLADPQLKVREADLKLRQAKSALARAKLALDECEVRAPRTGRVLRVTAAVGDLAAPTAPAVIFCPDEPLIVRAEVEQEFAGRVAAGMRVTVQDDARSDSHAWSGRVLRKSPWIARKRSVLFEPGQLNDVRTQEFVIQLDPAAAPLTLGQRVRVMIHAGEK